MASIFNSSILNNISEKKLDDNKSNTDNHIKHNTIVGSYGSHKSLNKYICDICDYTTDKKSNYDKHLSSIKHVKKVANNNSIYKCESCGYTTTVKYCYDKHITSIKHKMNMAFTNSKKE